MWAFSSCSEWRLLFIVVYGLLIEGVSLLAWKIPWTEEPGRLQSTGSQEADTTE